MKIIIIKFQKSLDKLNSRLSTTKQKIMKPEGRYEEIIQNATQRHKEMEERMKSCNLCLIRV